MEIKGGRRTQKYRQKKYSGIINFSFLLLTEKTNFSSENVLLKNIVSFFLLMSINFVISYKKVQKKVLIYQ